jgi:integrase
MASIRKRGKNSYLLIQEQGYDAKGKRIQHTKTILVEDPSLRRAPKRLQEYLNTELVKFKMEVESGTYVTPEKLTFKAFVDQWKRKHVFVDLADKTIDNYLLQLDNRIVPYFENLYMDQVKTMHILDYLEFLRTPEARMDGKKNPLGSATIVYNYRILRSLFGKAVEWNILKKNPMIGIKKPNEDDVGEMQYYEEAEIGALFLALENEPLHLRSLVILAITTGMRRAELLGLEWKYIDLDRGILEIKNTIPKFKNGKPVVKGTKNKKTRKIALSPSVVAELQMYYEEWMRERNMITELWEDGKFEYLFCHPNGKPLNPERLTKHWTAFYRRHKLRPIRLHDLRHTSVSWMIYQKVHLAAIAKRVGHSNTKMMSIYGHIFESVDQAAASVFDHIVKPKKDRTNA